MDSYQSYLLNDTIMQNNTLHNKSFVFNKRVSCVDTLLIFFIIKQLFSTHILKSSSVIHYNKILGI